AAPLGASSTGTATAAGGGAGGGSGSGGRLGRAAMWMAAGTTISRLTGLLRVLALAYALGVKALATSFNLANTTPNMIYDIVLGGILAATFIPVFVDRLATRSERDAWRAISAVITIAAVLLVAMTVVFWVLAPEVVSAYTVFAHARGSTVARFAHERTLAVTLLRWFVPQVALYGFISLMTALLNTRRRFAAPMWVPIANNLVVIVTLVWFHAIVGTHPTLASVTAHSGDIVLLGLGTTLGVALQLLALIPACRDVGLSRLRWRWEPGHEAVRTILRLGGWTFGFVVANQLALYVVMALAYSLGKATSGPLTSYTYAYTFMQMPYAIVAVSVMSAVTPDLSERWATGDEAGFRRRLTSGLRATLAVILPASMGMLVLAKPAVALLVAHGSTSVSSTATISSALAMFAFGLPGFCTYLYVVRVLQSMQRTKVAFWLYLLENGLNVVLALALVHPLGVRGLALALTIAYSISSVVGIAVLRGWLGRLGAPGAWAPLRRACWATLVMGAVVLVVSDLSGAERGFGLLLRVGAAVAAGVAVYATFAVLFGGRQRPLALLTGEPRRSTTAASTASSREDVGSGAGLGAVWGDTRVPVNTGPRIRIVPAPGSQPRGARPPPEAGAGRPIGSSRGLTGPSGPAAGRGRVPAAPIAPASPLTPTAPTTSAKGADMAAASRAVDSWEQLAPTGSPSHAAHAGAGAHVKGTGARETGTDIGTEPDTDSGTNPGADDADDVDDVGERRWIGGTTSSRRQPPR
ncbi:MAG: murein biosynthesis integral membrane protein MurJ, partial [Acidimicrobiales bacterium]